MTETVVVLGASPKSERYSFKAVQLLSEYGHRVLPVNPYHAEVSGVSCIASMAEVCEKVDTVTVYVRAELLKNDLAQIIELAPRRVIFNPGTESAEMAESLERAGIAAEEACTLVLLRTGQY
ncbi:CoA-binding protein [Zhongshania aquimaris]|uniref:CoA-binding protein n=1 Tax=Zhongshania aquimaris TaxID=2857107 RepID=A0ABS6VUR6_9GAMM|nr:CoA-binding protein [Zhongshania aquimaris]MBW2942063.1 CoA-binding protein [Zhongshania aquimaris]